MNICSNCGTENKEGAKFCLSCGAKLNDIKNVEPVAKLTQELVEVDERQDLLNHLTTMYRAKEYEEKLEDELNETRKTIDKISNDINTKENEKFSLVNLEMNSIQTSSISERFSDWFIKIGLVGQIIFAAALTLIMLASIFTFPFIYMILLLIVIAFGVALLGKKLGCLPMIGAIIGGVIVLSVLTRIPAIGTILLYATLLLPSGIVFFFVKKLSLGRADYLKQVEERNEEIRESKLRIPAITKNIEDFELEREALKSKLKDLVSLYNNYTSSDAYKNVMNYIHDMTIQNTESLAILYFIVDSGRADTKKEMLQEYDKSVRHQEIVEYLGTIEKTLEAIKWEITKSFEELTSEVQSLNLTMEKGFSNVTTAVGEVNKNISDLRIQQATETAALLSEQAYVSDQLYDVDSGLRRQFSKYRNERY